MVEANICTIKVIYSYVKGKYEKIFQITFPTDKYKN